MTPIQTLLDTLKKVHNRTNDKAINSLTEHDNQYLAALLQHHSSVQNSHINRSSHLETSRRFIVSYEEPDPDTMLDSAAKDEIDKMSNVLSGQSNDDISPGAVLTTVAILIRESALERIEGRLEAKMNVTLKPSNEPNDYRPNGNRRLSNSSESIFNSEYLPSLHMDVVECVEYYSDSFTKEDVALCDDVKLAFREDNLVSFVGDDDIVDGKLVPDIPSRIEDRSSAIRSVRYYGFPNDTYFRRQWSHVDRNTSVNSMSWYRTWYQSPPAPLSYNPPYTSREPMVVAVIDSGVNYMNKDLQESIYYNSKEDCTNGLDDDNNGFVDDCFGWNFVENTNDPLDDAGHGTAAASLIAAKASNQYGITPFCWNCLVLPVKVLDQNLEGAISNILKAINYALVHGVKISNNSYGGRNGFGPLEEGVRRAQKRGMIMVISAGNQDPDIKPACDIDKDPMFPASLDYDNIVSVAAINQNGALADFSCFGKNSVDVAAPGERVIGAGLKYPFTYNNGTSFSSPIVAGIIASIWNENVLLSYREVISILYETVRKLPWLETKVKYGGIPDIYRATYVARSTRGRFNGHSTDIEEFDGPVPLCNHSGKCGCPEGFEYITERCIDIDECNTLENVCGNKDEFDKFRSLCTNEPGGYTCTCRPGFVDRMGGINSKRVDCVDTNECKMNTSNCPSSSSCLNIPGDVECVCDSKPNQYYDRGMNRCVDADNLTILSCKNPRTEIMNNDGCVCRDGYAKNKDGATCVPIGALVSFDVGLYTDMVRKLNKMI